MQFVTAKCYHVRYPTSRGSLLLIQIAARSEQHNKYVVEKSQRLYQRKARCWKVTRFFNGRIQLPWQCSNLPDEYGNGCESDRIHCMIILSWRSVLLLWKQFYQFTTLTTITNFTNNICLLGTELSRLITIRQQKQNEKFMQMQNGVKI